MKINNNTPFFVLALLAFAVVALLPACKQKPQPVQAKAPNKFYYTCSMHPQVHEEHPGSCPICGMKLIKVEVTGTGASAANITLTAAQAQLAGIQIDTVKEQNVGSQKTLTATVTADQTLAEQLSARVPGRIQQLFVRTIGQAISAGQPVYTVYSEDLQEAEKEYLLARQQQKVLNNPDVDYKQLINAAESKLSLWGLTPAQIKSLAATNKVAATTTIYTKVSGIVTEITVHEGDYVTEGMPILKSQSLSTLWVEAQAYAGETAAFQPNSPVNVSLPDLGLTIPGKLSFTNPELADQSKVDLIRISIPNPGSRIRPGMQAYVSIATGKQTALAIPASAIITEGSGTKVWLKNADGSYSGHRITIGPGNESYVPVTSGLSAGQLIVTNGAYLLNSEAIFKNGQ